VQKKQIVAGNKTDLITDAKVLDDLREKIEGEGFEFFPICTLTGEGLKPLLEKVWKYLQELPDAEPEIQAKTIVYDVPKDEFEVEVVDGVYFLKGKRVEKLVNMTDFDNPVSLRRFDKAWRFMGLEKLLKQEGISEGDTVNLYGMEFTFSEPRKEED